MCFKMTHFVRQYEQIPDNLELVAVRTYGPIHFQPWKLRAKRLNKTQCADFWYVNFVVSYTHLYYQLDAMELLFLQPLNCIIN